MGHLEPANYLFLEGYVLGHVPFRPHAGHWVRCSLVGSLQLQRSNAHSCLVVPHRQLAVFSWQLQIFGNVHAKFAKNFAKLQAGRQGAQNSCRWKRKKRA